MIIDSADDFIKKFKNEDIVVHCPMEEEARKFLKFLSKNGIKWSNGNELDVNNETYHLLDEKTCYRYITQGIVYASDKFYRDHGCIIIKFSSIEKLINGDKMNANDLNITAVYKSADDIIQSNYNHIDLNRLVVDVPISNNIEKYCMKLDDEYIVEISTDELSEFVLEKKKENKIAKIYLFDIKESLIIFGLYINDVCINVKKYRLRRSDFEIIKTLTVDEILAAMNKGIKIPTEMDDAMHIFEYIVYKLFKDEKYNM